MNKRDERVYNSWKLYLLKEDVQSLSDKRKIRVPKGEAEKLRAQQQQAASQPPPPAEEESSSPFSLSNIATSLAISYGLSKASANKAAEVAMKGPEAIKAALNSGELSRKQTQLANQILSRFPKDKVAGEVAKQAGKTVAQNVPKGELIKSFLTNTGSKIKGSPAQIRAGAQAVGRGIQAARGIITATELGGTPMTVGGTYTTFGTAAAVTATATAILAGAAIGSGVGYLINKGVSSLGTGYNEILKTSLDKAQKDRNYLISELNGYMKGGYKYELGTEENEEEHGLGFTTKGERVKTGVLGFGSEVRTPGSYDAKDGPIIIGLLSILFNNEKSAGKIKEEDIEVDGEVVNTIDISDSSLMAYKPLLDKFGYIDDNTGQFMPNNLMLSRVPQELKSLVISLALAYKLASLNQK